ncbi:hypothetical protein Taro_045981 [Colocasia esculenta]|uniref:Cyclin-like domain-containing protein n=1 Tax=Colocasia esculenta TaxID=4460 RepID=A0A843WSL5_COLES|nr:hypothetical protein [Colocasia esculenta]
MAMIGSQACRGPDGLLEVPQDRSKWYFSKKEIEVDSPSRKDGIDLMKENQLRAQYCSFLKELGMKLGMPQLTIATAMMFCHRFYLRQSHAKNDWQTMATVCLFLASKVEEPPCSLSKVITAAYEMIHRKDPTAVKRIQSKDVYEKQKDIITTGERMLLATIEFDLDILHPYKPLFAASKKLGIVENGVLRVAWNFVNDWLRTTLCLQYKPHYVAAGSIYFAAKLCKVKLPAEKDLVWWREFDVMPQLFEEAKQQMMELFGCKQSPVAPCTKRKETPAPLEIHKEASCSPESCVLSRPGSAGSAGHDLHMEAGEAAMLWTACKDEARSHVDHKLSISLNPAGVQSVSLQLRTQDSESLNDVLDRERTPTFGNVQECKGQDQITSRPGWNSKGITNTDRERIRATLKRRRQEREVSRVKAPDSSSEDAWIERELESELDLVREPTRKKPSLSEDACWLERV